uniref:Cytochrome c oxidase assembly protein COX16 homolog, mitochondrial n=1 Tax=Sinocyclocheilus anshuiensis TaxID=1608454 RepID=A0A671Q9L0_9TELE
WNQVRKLQKNWTVKYGIPMLLDPTLEARVNTKKQLAILQDEYEKLKDLDLDVWKNIRGPRPWEDSKEYQEEQLARLNKGT